MSEHLNADTYEHLKAIANRISASRRGVDTIQPTALLHEAWEKMERHGKKYSSKAHFMATAAQAMRQILVDRARSRLSARRGGGAVHRMTLSGVSANNSQPLDILMLDEALQKLEALDPTAARVAVLRTFSGLTVGETAEATGMSQRSVSRAWRFARSFLVELMDS